MFIDVFGVVRIKPVRMLHDDFAGNGHRRWVAAEHRKFDFSAADRNFAKNLRIKFEGVSDCVSEIRGGCDLTNSNGRSRVRWLRKQREAQPGQVVVHLLWINIESIPADGPKVS